MKKGLRKVVAVIADILGAPITLLSALWLWLVRKALIDMPVSDAIFMKVGMLPVVDHYYEPMINPKKYLSHPLNKDRKLPGLDLNIDDQLELLSRFHYNGELSAFPVEQSGALRFYYNNPLFASGDAEYLYNIVRHFKPARLIEIGSGNSTLMVRNALEQNGKETPGYTCKHICIEPYEMSWLEKSGVEVIRKKVEEVELSFFQSLQANDILFIDSSHMIRPQGDVLVEYHQILPILRPGVIVHIHDIFTPKDYPQDWVYTHKLWNEQYLLESFLCFNNQYKVIGALNYLLHHHREALTAKCPILAAQQAYREPGSFWMIRQ